MGSTGNLRKELRATLQAAASLENEWRKLSAAEKASAQGQELRAKIDELIQKGGELRDTMGDVNSAITRVASDTAQIDAAVGALGAINAVAEVLTRCSVENRKSSPSPRAECAARHNTAISTYPQPPSRRLDPHAECMQPTA